MSNNIDLSGAVFRKSTRCDNSGPNCVEVAALPGGHVGLRDSKHVGGPVLVFDAAEWSAFSAGVKAGEFDA